MRLHRPACAWPLQISLAVACVPQGDSPAGASNLGDSSSSSTTMVPLTTDTPTSVAPTSTSTGPGPGDLTTSTGDADTAGTSSGSGSTIADPPSSGCGDGQLDPGEECDPGFAALSDTGACTLACKTAKCGDSLVWTDKEACDNGPGNNDSLYGGCTTQCDLGPRCDDGQVQGPEECDLGRSNGTGEFPSSGVPCDDGCRFRARLAFLSSAVYKAGDLGGVEGAHIKCRNLAAQAKYDNATKFMAWISDAQHSPFQDFIRGPETVGLAYVRPDGVRVADDWDALVLTGPSEGITVTDAGEVLLNTPVWTGTAPSGKVLDPGAHCQSWTSSSPFEKSRVGSSGFDKAQQKQAWAEWVAERQWTNLASLSCDKSYHLYCLEQ